MGFVIFIEGVLGLVVIKEISFGHIGINRYSHSQKEGLLSFLVAKRKV